MKINKNGISMNSILSYPNVIRLLIINILVNIKYDLGNLTYELSMNLIDHQSYENEDFTTILYLFIAGFLIIFVGFMSIKCFIGRLTKLFFVFIFIGVLFDISALIIIELNL